MHIKRYEVSDLGNKSHFFAIAAAAAAAHCYYGCCCRSRYSIASLCGVIRLLLFIFLLLLCIGLDDNNNNKYNDNDDDDDACGMCVYVLPFRCSVSKGNLYINYTSQKAFIVTRRVSFMYTYTCMR